MRRIVADTGPLKYLILIGEIGLLPRLSDSVLIPDEVRLELLDPLAPPSVREWIADPPPWLHVVAGQYETFPSLKATLANKCVGTPAQLPHKT